MKKLRGYRRFLLIYSAVLLILVAVILFFASALLREYEAAQPERLTEAFAGKLYACETEEDFRACLSIPDELDSVFHEGSDYYDSFVDAVRSYYLLWQRRAGLDENGDVVWVLRHEDIPVVELTIHCKSTETKLGFLTVSHYETVMAKPIYYHTEIAPVASLRFFSNGEEMSFANGKTYSSVTLEKPEIEIGDQYGTRIPYDPQKTYTLTEHHITVPSDCTVAVGDAALDPADAEVTENPILEEASVYLPDLPSLSCYTISVLEGGEPTVEVTAKTGEKIPAEWNGSEILIKTTKTKDTLPEGVDPLEIAKTWSLFMTQDLGDARNFYGYYKVGAYLIKDSYLDKVAFKWATNIDIHFINYHTLCDPPFLDESLDNIVRYSDDCFSCDVHFIKHFVLDEGNDIRDPMNSTFTFIRYDGSWRLVSITEIVSEES